MLATHIPTLTDEQRTQTYGGKGYFRGDLFVFRIFEDKWLIGRKDEEGTPEILTISMSNWEYIFREPIAFDTYQKAEQWCQRGTIGELQEAYSCLAVGFSHQSITRREQIYDKW